MDPLFDTNGFLERLLVLREHETTMVRLTDILLVASWDAVSDAQSDRVTDLQDRYQDMDITLRFTFETLLTSGKDSVSVLKIHDVDRTCC